MARVAFVTSKDYPGISDDDKLVIEPCAKRGLTVVEAQWEDPKVAWSKFDAVVIRSPWNYYLQLEKFTEWLKKLKKERVNLWNPADVLLWNTDKRYLKELESSGVEIVPTAWLVFENNEDLLKRLRDLFLGRFKESKRLVIKPAVSAGAHGTFVIEGANPVLSHDYVKGETLLVQPYLETIEKDGEWSLLFFGGNFSHALRKTPASGDFRVQEKLGGKCVGAAAPETLIQKGRDVLQKFGRETLYARVDFIPVEEKIYLGELEATEPSLFFGFGDAAAPERFAAELAKRART